MKFKNVLLVVAAAVVFGSVAEAMEARPMPTLDIAMFSRGQQWFPLEKFPEYRNFMYVDDETNSYVLARDGQTGNAGYAKLAWSRNQNKLCINAINTGDLWSPSASDYLTPATYDQIVNWLTPEEKQKERTEFGAQVDSRSLPTGTDRSVAEASATASDYYHNTKTNKYYVIKTTYQNKRRHYIQQELMLTERGLLRTSGDRRVVQIADLNSHYTKSDEGQALAALRKQQEDHARYTARRNKLAAIAAIIAALMSWRAYKHRNLVVGAAERTSEMEALLASLAWYDSGSVKAARALQALWRWLPKKEMGEDSFSALSRWYKQKNTEQQATA